MHEQAFETLGIAATTDGRVIRAAFVRLARIYHPDRFVGMPDDVRAEAERRMKEATTAYETLRAARKASSSEKKLFTESELRERAEMYRLAMRAKQTEEARDRARWQRWDDIEKAARERARIEAEIEAMIRGDMEPSADRYAKPEADSSDKVLDLKAGSLLSQRLDAARRGETAPLARRPSND